MSTGHTPLLEMPELPERDAKDYAIEHGEYLASAAESLLQSMTAVMNAKETCESVFIDGDVTIANFMLEQALESQAERMRALSGRVYEFRIRSARALAAVSQGWVMVPKEPTPAMLIAAVECRMGTAVYKCISRPGLDVMEEEAGADWAAMLAAAPKAADGSGGER